MGEGVVAGAQELGVAGVGLAAAAPERLVVDVAERGGDVAAGVLAVALLDNQRDALGLGLKAGPATLVEHLGLGAEDGRDDPGFAGEHPRSGGTDALAGVELG